MAKRDVFVKVVAGITMRLIGSLAGLFALWLWDLADFSWFNFGRVFVLFAVVHCTVYEAANSARGGWFNGKA